MLQRLQGVGSSLRYFTLKKCKKLNICSLKLFLVWTFAGLINFKLPKELRLNSQMIKKIYTHFITAIFRRETDNNAYFIISNVIFTH